MRVVGHVASATGFVQQPAVINGASDLLVQIFGEAGRHSQVALGAAELPCMPPSNWNYWCTCELNPSVSVAFLPPALCLDIKNRLL